MQLSNQVYALSNASSFGVSYTVMGGKKATTPIVYTLECNQGKIIINYYSTERIKNDATGLTESKHSMLQVAEIKAIPGSLYVNFNRDLLPNKLCFDNYSFHWELLCNYALPDWIYRATDLVESNKIAPVWLIVSKLIELTCYDDLTNELTINETNLVKPFVELDWWKVLLQCSKECAGIVQFANAVKMIPDQFKPKLGLVAAKTIPMDYITNLRDIGYNFIDWTKIKDISTLPDNFSQADLESHLINNGYTPKKLTADDIIQLNNVVA